MVEKRLECLECGKRVANTSNVLARHIRSVHSIEWPDYVVKHEMGGVWPTCICGCGEKLTWRKGGFGKYVKGHDATIQASVTPDASIRPGWTLNPFTGREEHISSDDEIAFLEHCTERHDPVTHDHGIRVGWEDAAGKLQIAVPSFKHLQQRLIIVIESVGDPDAGRRLVGYKAWCDEHGYMLLVLRRDHAGFSVTGGHKPKGGLGAKKA